MENRQQEHRYYTNRTNNNDSIGQMCYLYDVVIEIDLWYDNEKNVYENQDNTGNNYIVVLASYIKYVDDRVFRETILSKQDYLIDQIIYSP